MFPNIHAKLAIKKDQANPYATIDIRQTTAARPGTACVRENQWA
jgi:hypothetical protein